MSSTSGSTSKRGFRRSQSWLATTTRSSRDAAGIRSEARSGGRTEPCRQPRVFRSPASPSPGLLGGSAPACERFEFIVSLLHPLQVHAALQRSCAHAGPPCARSARKFLELGDEGSVIDRTLLEQA